MTRSSAGRRPATFECGVGVIQFFVAQVPVGNKGDCLIKAVQAE